MSNTGTYIWSWHTNKQHNIKKQNKTVLVHTLSKINYMKTYVNKQKMNIGKISIAIYQHIIIPYTGECEAGEGECRAVRSRVSE